jgi:hypothetical protein
MEKSPVSVERIVADFKKSTFDHRRFRILNFFIGEGRLIDFPFQIKKPQKIKNPPINSELKIGAIPVGPASPRKDPSRPANIPRIK